MDSWFVAAAAAAGYFATNWHNLSENRNGCPEFSSGDSRYGKAKTGNGSIHKLVRRRKIKEDSSTDGKEIFGRKVSDTYWLNMAAAAEVDSSSGFDVEKVGILGNHTACTVVSPSSSAPRFIPNRNLTENECGKGTVSDSCSITRMESFNNPTRKRSLLKTKYSHGHLLKPLSSLESCLIAQLYMQHAKLEEYILGSLAPPSTPTLRPLLITDGSQIIGRASDDFSGRSDGTGDYIQPNEASFRRCENVFGIPSLPKIESLDHPKKLKFKRGNRHIRKLSTTCKVDNEKQFHLQWGSHNGVVLFFLGISVGVIASYVGNRKEMDKLRGLLKQNENLVQDLQEELEMKDSLTVKELANENYESRETYDNSFHDRPINLLSDEQNMNNSTSYDYKESYCEKVEESSEAMSKIEAELEAELERLGLNMSNADRRWSDLVELDPDFTADFAEGELRPDMVNGLALIQSVSDEDRSGTPTTHSGNYAVSPQELSLRLHEVIQSRLEERIEELEMALHHSQRKVKLMESECKNSNHESKYEEFDGRSKPLVMKLSGEALHAYNEACEELLKVDESEEEDAASDNYQSNHQKELQHIFDRNMSWIDRSGTAKVSEELLSGEGRILLEEQPQRIQELHDFDLSEGECSDCNNETEKPDSADCGENKERISSTAKCTKDTVFHG